MVQERALYIMREVMLGDVAAPQEWFETPTTSMPPVTFPPHPRRLQFAGIGPYTVALGYTHGVGLYMPAVLGYIWAIHMVLGYICWRLLRNGGCGSYMLVLDCTRWRCAVHDGVWLE